MNIDEIIARSTHAGEFSERHSFTVARELAIQKMRQFALADPHYYVLELIQAAVANQATHVDLRIGARDFVLSYVGGGFSQHQLAQIFDFLFASRSDVSTGAIRQLALGINALMRFEPQRVILESGDGTLAGTTRVAVDPLRNLVEVGTPEVALNGTFLRAEGLVRARVRGQSLYQPTDYGPPECSLIEERCLAAPIPILVNDHSPFGYTSVRTPKLLGFDDVVDFDEGDFYGSIGIARKAHQQGFKLLTWGVWVQTLQLAVGDDGVFGGIVTFNGFNKTADHAGVVRDGQFEAFLARLRPYVQQVEAARAGAGRFQVRTLDAEALTPPQIRTLADAHAALVTVDPAHVADAAKMQRARDLAGLFGAPVLQVSPRDLPIFAGIVGASAQVLRPGLEDSTDFELFAQAAPAMQATAMLVDPVRVGQFRTEELLGRMQERATQDGSRRRQAEMAELLEQLGGQAGTHVGYIVTPLDAAVPPEAVGKGVWAQVSLGTAFKVPRALMLDPWSFHLLRSLGKLVSDGYVVEAAEDGALGVGQQDDALILSSALCPSPG